MEKLGQLLAQDRWDLVVVDTPPSRNALDFLDAPKRLGSFMDSRLWRLLLAPGRGIGRLVTGVMGLAMKAMSTVLGSKMLSDAAAFVQSLDATFGVSGRRPTELMRCSNGAVPSSWWCLRPSPMRCVRRRSSSTG